MDIMYKIGFFLFLGIVMFLSIGAVYAQTPLFTVRGQFVEDFYGNSVSGVGDTNADGFLDFVVGERNYGGTFVDGIFIPGCNGGGGTTGALRLYSGKDGLLLHEWCGATVGQLGWSASGAGDVNGDGIPDIIAGDILADMSPTDKNYGSATVFSGSDYSTLYTFYGDYTSSYFGDAVASGGDINKDGYNDVIVGSLFDDTNGFDSGLARVFSGKDGSILYNFTGDKSGDGLGSSVAGIGDINADGFDDVLVGAEQANVIKGYARVYSGKDGSIIHTFFGDAKFDTFGYAVAGLGDINGDSVPDFAIGAPGLSATLTDISGYVRIFSGLDGSVLYTLIGDFESDYFGYAISNIGDVNNDDAPDILVGAPREGFIGLPGYARIFSGLDGSFLYEMNGEANSDRFGYSVSGLENGSDHTPKIIIGAAFDDPADALNPPGYTRVYGLSDMVSMGSGSELVMRKSNKTTVQINGSAGIPHTLVKLYGSLAPELPTKINGITAYLDSESFNVLTETMTDNNGKWKATFTIPKSILQTTYSLQAFYPNKKEATKGLYITIE